MLDWTTSHCRYFHRLLTKQAVLYSEMVSTGAIIHGNREQHLSFNEAEQPVALQLGGSSAKDLAQCSKIAEDYAYNEVNLNVGCPSDRVQSGRFGACLMADPHLVAECIDAMQSVTKLPVTVKSRIGIDDLDAYEDLVNFIEVISGAGCHTFILHARKAWLSGLSPKQNREVPPLRYDIVQQVKQDFPHLEIIINGGVVTLDKTQELLLSLDGVMIGREAYHNPYLLAEVDNVLFNQHNGVKTRQEIVLALIPYIQGQLSRGVKLHSITRHILGLFYGIAGAKAWRRELSKKAPLLGADEDVVLQALNLVQL
jgi:tRNA-dihydrouridine synthase A